MRESTFDKVQGNLGCSARSHQRTLKRKAGKIPWKQITISVYGGDLLASFSFDGRTYSDELIVADGDTVVLVICARAVRVKVPRRKKYDFISYNILCWD